MDGSTTYTDTDENRQCTDILLIGKTGNGKSSTGNSILGRRAFQCMARPTSVTKDVQMEYSDVGGRIVKVVDGPGVCDTDLSETSALELVVRAMQFAVAENPRGYHAILLVLRYGDKLTHENKQAVQLLKGIFGPDFVEKFTILVLTHGDMFDPEEANARTFEEWCFQQEGAFKDLLVECKSRVILFDNKTKDVDKLNDQRYRLFTMIDNLSQNRQRYSDKHFMMAQRERDRLLVESERPVIRERSVMEASLIIQQLGRIQLDEPQERLTRLLQLRPRADRLIQSIIEQDRGTGVLRDVLNNAQHISQAVNEQIENTDRAIEMNAQREQRLQNMEQLQVDEERYRSQGQGEAQQQAQQQIAELQRQLEESQARYEELAEQLRQTNMKVEQEYHSVVRRQEEGFLPMIMRVISEILPQAMKIIFRK